MTSKSRIFLGWQFQEVVPTCRSLFLPSVASASSVRSAHPCPPLDEAEEREWQARDGAPPKIARGTGPNRYWMNSYAPTHKGEGLFVYLKPHLKAISIFLLC